MLTTENYDQLKEIFGEGRHKGSEMKANNNDALWNSHVGLSM